MRSRPGPFSSGRARLLDRYYTDYPAGRARGSLATPLQSNRRQHKLEKTISKHPDIPMNAPHSVAKEIGHYIAGRVFPGKSGRYADVFDPATGQVSGRVTLAGHSEVEQAIAAAKNAFPAWRGDFFIGAIAGQHLRRVRVRDGRATDQEILLRNRNERIRDVRVGPDGFLYLLTDDSEGKVLRVRPG